jgi:hypothetical protein
MITDTFNRRTLANMEVALERACLLLPTDGARAALTALLLVPGPVGMVFAYPSDTKANGAVRVYHSAKVP